MLLGSGLYQSARLQLHYKHLKEIYVICILNEITSLRLSRVVIFFYCYFVICVFIFNVQYTAYTAFPVLHVLTKFRQPEL